MVQGSRGVRVKLPVLVVERLLQVAELLLKLLRHVLVPVGLHAVALVETRQCVVGLEFEMVHLVE